MVRQVQEVYVDYFPLAPDLFTLDIGSCMPLETPHGDQALLQHICSSLTAVLLALKVSREQHPLVFHAHTCFGPFVLPLPATLSVSHLSVWLLHLLLPHPLSTWTCIHARVYVSMLHPLCLYVFEVLYACGVVLASSKTAPRPLSFATPRP